MKVCMRADASRQIGSGHVMRCLVLADWLRAESGAQTVFLCRELPGHLIGYIRERGYDVALLPDSGEDESPAIAAAAAVGPDWLIVDHYGLDRRFEERVRPHAKQLMAIDDLADRPHACDVLLDPNYDPDAGSRYRKLVGPDTRLLVGPSYALLRPSFAAARPRVRRDGRIRRLLVSFGGVDATGETGKTLEALAPLAELGLEITVLAGSANPRSREIAEQCADLPNVRFHRHAEQVAELMLEADAAIGAGGTTTWERCCLGLPALVVTTAANQEPLTAQAARAGAVRWLGRAAEVDPGMIRDAALAMIRDPAGMRRMSALAMELTDGLGADRIVKELVVR